LPRDLPLGNGALLVNFDEKYQLRDLYWPYIGQENHTAGHPFRFGVWVNGVFSWVAEGDWQRTLVYEPDTLQTRITLVSARLGITLHCADVVDFHENLFMRQIDVENAGDQPCEVRLFFAQDFHISGTEVGDSAYYEPERRAVFHYKGKRWFLINTAREGTDEWDVGVDQWAVGFKEMGANIGTWRDAEDGVLSGNAVAQGSVDSCVALHLTLPPHGHASGWYWIAVGEDFPTVTRINRAIRQKGPVKYLKRTQHYWSLWSSKELPVMVDTTGEETAQYRRSLHVIRSQVDNGGAIIASTDFELAHAAHDTYCYMWPRDGALAAAALTDAGYQEVAQRFFTFCHQIITREGYFLHKYNPDGTLASSWLGWYYEGRKELPIQQDETALILWALWRHFQRYRDVEFIKPLYRGLIIRAANWIVSFRDEDTGLPLPSWDLWEERRGIHAWTVGAVWGGLQAAANFAGAFGEDDLAELYRGSAKTMKAAADRYCWNEDLGYFQRAISADQQGNGQADSRPDTSVVGLWLFGMYPPDHPRITGTMQKLRDLLWVNTPVGGMARYRHDQFHQVSQDIEHVPGNPWFICTLWWARWYAETVQRPEDLTRAWQLLDWARSHALPSGIMSEQINPYTGELLSVCPLTWSHAEYVNALHACMQAKQRLTPADREPERWKRSA